MEKHLTDIISIILSIILFILFLFLILKIKREEIDGEIVEITKSPDYTDSTFSLTESNRLLISLDILKIKTQEYGEITVFQNTKNELNDKVKVKLKVLNFNDIFKNEKKIILDGELID